MGREFELKFRATPQDLTALREKYGPFAAITMKTVYYDTPDGALRPIRWTLRRRLENGQPICTLKTPGADGSRGEWEIACEDILESVPKLIALGAPGELAQLTQGGVVPTCGVQFTRLAAEVTYGASRLELALDQGEFLGGDKTAPFAEVEVELKEGCDADASAFAAEMAQAYNLTEQPLSKLKRALDLAAM